MLTALSIRRFALIDALELELGPGMTVFSGETGAGKSMLIDALGAVFGARASADWVRQGAERAEVTAVWEGDAPGLRDILAAQELDEDETLILRRIIAADGRSRAFVNGVPVPARVLREIGACCLDLHGQHEHQTLLQPAFQRRLLDDLIEPACVQAVREAYAHWRELRTRMERLRTQSAQLRAQADWMREELARLEALAPEPGMLAMLEREVERGRHHGQLQQAVAEAMQWLDEAEPNARAMIGRAMQALAQIAHMDEGLQDVIELTEQADALLAEGLPTLRRIAQQPFDELALQEAEDRLAKLRTALRRHDTDEAGLQRLIEQWREQLQGLDTAAWDEHALAQALEQAAGSYLEAAERLHRARHAAADCLLESLRPLLDRLALRGMQVRFRIEAGEEWQAHGRDRIAIEIMANPGEPWRPLNTTISGGELSRFVLALKGCDALRHAAPLAVFDEVDTGIGGETAWHVGRLLAEMGQRRQVLVISHLPQVASCAAHHVRIEKRHEQGRTFTDVCRLDAAAREREIARVLGADDDEGRRHARAFLQRAGRG